MASGDRITCTGLVVVGAAAAVMSFAALAGLAAIAGLVGHLGPLRLAWLLPVAVDAYAATATGVWLRAGVSPATRSWHAPTRCPRLPRASPATPPTTS
jgi:hypothetical protein